MNGELTLAARPPNFCWQHHQPAPHQRSEPLESSQNGDALSPLAGSGLHPRLGQLRCIPLLRIASYGWTRPLWQDDEPCSTLVSSFLNPNLFRKEILAWTLCETQRQVERNMMDQRRQWHAPPAPPPIQFLGPLTWLGAWEEANREMVNGWTDEEVGEAMLFFAEEFYPRVDYWRNRVGFDAMGSDLWAGLDIDWPNGQLQPIGVRMQHGPDVYECELSWTDGADISQLIRFQWCRHAWAWEKGLRPSLAPTYNFGAPRVASTSDSDLWTE